MSDEPQKPAAGRAKLDELVKDAHPELRQVAERALRRESASTIRPTALAHEIYLRLAQLTALEWHDKQHLLAMASRVARQVLVDEARRRKSRKRDGGVAVTLEHLELAAADRDVVLVDDLLREMESFDAVAASVVELRVFGGLSLEEIAAELETSLSTVNRKWRAGRTWLAKELAG